MSKHIYLDIETIPCQDPEHLEKLLKEAHEYAESEVALLKPPGSLKKQETIDAWIENEMPVKAQSIRAAAITAAEDKYRATSFDGGLGQIAVIGLALDNEDPITFYGEDFQNPETEPRVLRQFYDLFGDVVTSNRGLIPVVVGHNVAAFDLRFIFQRSVVLGICPHPAIPFKAKPWEDNKVYDTMIGWTFDIRGKASMNKVCQALGLEGKGDIDGSKVWDYVRDGKISEVAKYCSGDIERTRAIHKRLTFAGVQYPSAIESFGLEAA